jgi:hypothetical protein
MTGGLNINRRRFALAGSAGFSALAVILVALFLTGTVFAAFPIAGVGGFVIKANSISGTNFELIPAVGDTEKQSAWPQAQVTMDSVSIVGLNLSKELDVSALFPGVVDMVKVVITATGTTTGNGLVLNTTGIEADSAIFNTMLIDERFNASHPNSITPATGAEIGLKASSLTLTNAQLNTHYMTTTSITIPGMSLGLELYKGGVKIN